MGSQALSTGGCFDESLDKIGEDLSMKKPMWILISIFSSFLILLSCSDIKDLKFTSKNKNEIENKIKNSKSLTPEELGLLSIALFGASLSGESIEGKTVRQLIEEQRRIFAEEAIKEKEAKEETKKEAFISSGLSKYLTVVPDEKGFRPANQYDEIYDRIMVHFIVENKFIKDIRAFKGEAIFKDLFGKIILDIPLAYDNVIPQGQKITLRWETKFNSRFSDTFTEGILFGEEAKKDFNNRKLENMKFEWKPGTIIFTDGNYLGKAPEKIDE